MKHHHLTRTAFGSAVTGTLFVILSVWTADHRHGETGGMLLCLAVILWVVAGIRWVALDDVNDRATRIAVRTIESAKTNIDNAKKEARR